ncbi:MAG: hypothetical protein WA705_12350 [Candidatus Ozemobacteraceae bacterium]
MHYNTIEFLLIEDDEVDARMMEWGCVKAQARKDFLNRIKMIDHFLRVVGVS